MNSRQSCRLWRSNDDHSGSLCHIIYESITQTGRNTNNCTIAVNEEIKLAAFKGDLDMFLKTVI